MKYILIIMSFIIITIFIGCCCIWIKNRKLQKENKKLKSERKGKDEEVGIRNNAEIQRKEHSNSDSDVRFNYVNLRQLQAASMGLPAEIELPDVEEKMTKELGEDSMSSDSSSDSDVNNTKTRRAPTNPGRYDQLCQLDGPTQYID